MNAREAIEHQWPYLLRFLPDPAMMERLASELGALRRHREISSATTLLRLAFVYGFCGYSLRATAAWAEATDVAHVSDVALLQRFRAASDWMLALLSAKVSARVPLPSLPVSGNGFRVRLVDATTISKPGSTGTDWRVHLSYDLGQGRIDSVAITDRSGGESLRRFSIAEGDLVVADRAYATRAGFASVLAQNGNFLVRLPWSNVPLQADDGSAFDLISWLRTLPDATPSEAAVNVQLPTGRAAVRVVAIRKSECAAEHARSKAMRNESRRGEKLDLRTLEAAGYVVLLTNLTSAELSAPSALELYRFRWQIEICFKHLKSIIEIDTLPAKDPQLAITAIAAKMLGALIIEDFTTRYVSFFPWGYPTEGTPAVVLATA